MKKRALLLLVLLLWVNTADAAISVIQTKNSTRSAGAGSATNAFTSNVTTGSGLVACTAIFNATGGVPVVSDNVNGTYTEGFYVMGDAGSSLSCFYTLNATSGATTVTVNPPGSSADIDIVLFELGGISTLDIAVEAMQAYSAPSGATTAISTGTLAQAAEIIISGFSHTGPGNALAGDSGDSFTTVNENESNTGGQAYHIQYKIVSATTAVTVNGTIAAGGTGGPTWFTGAISFREGAVDTTAPSDPSDLAVTATGSETTALTWTASTDDVAVANYRVERCDGAACSDYAEVAQAVTNSYADSGLTANTLYRYRVRAVDTSLNFSGYTSTVDETTLQTQSVSVTWNDTNSSPDNEENYVVQRKTGPEGIYTDLATKSADATSHTDATSPTSTLDDSACYRVYAIATDYNNSEFSNEDCTPLVTGANDIGSRAVGVRFGGGVRFP